ncbi:MAG: thioredoxin-disulfide reductase [Rickettsiales bacterium]
MSKIKKTNILIIGSGPAGYTAAIYAARANLKPILIAGLQPGGQLTITTEVENYPGFADPIQGPWLMEQMNKQAENVGTEIIYENIEKVDFSTAPYKAYDMSAVEYQAETVIICTGAAAIWLGLKSEENFKGYGVSGCATCDGFFFKNLEVAVVGGGNTAVEEALYLTNHAKKVYLIHRRDELRAEKILQDRLFKNPKIEVIWDSVLTEVIGTEKPKKVTSALIQNVKTQKFTNLAVEGIFIAIGHKPNTNLFSKYLKTDQAGYIQTVAGSTKTNLAGIFAAGDVQDSIYRQAVTAAGTGCMAALEAERFLAEKN